MHQQSQFRKSQQPEKSQNDKSDLIDPKKDELSKITKALSQALWSRLLQGTQDFMADTLAQGITKGFKQAGGMPIGQGNDPDETWVSGKEYEKLESMTRQKDERIAEVRRQVLTAEADVQRIKSEVEKKEMTIQEKLTLLSKANAENKQLKLKLVDLEGKVRIMSRDSVDVQNAKKLADTEKREATEIINKFKALEKEHVDLIEKSKLQALNIQELLNHKDKLEKQIADLKAQVIQAEETAKQAPVMSKPTKKTTAVRKTTRKKTPAKKPSTAKDKTVRKPVKTATVKKAASKPPKTTKKTSAAKSSGGAKTAKRASRKSTTKKTAAKKE